MHSITLEKFMLGVTFYIEQREKKRNNQKFFFGVKILDDKYYERKTLFNVYTNVIIIISDIRKKNIFYFTI